MANIPKLLQEAHDEFYMWVGMCIADWAMVEDELFRICWNALSCPQKQAAIVFFRSPALENRLTLTSELVQAILPKTKSGKQPHADLKLWNEIVSKFEKLRPVRNMIAHHPVEPKTAVTEEGGGISGSPIGGAPISGGTLVITSWFEVYTSEAQLLRKGEADHPLLVGDLKAHHLGTLGLRHALNDFYPRFSAHFPEPPGPAPPHL